MLCLACREHGRIGGRRSCLCAGACVRVWQAHVQPQREIHGAASPQRRRAVCADQLRAVRCNRACTHLITRIAVVVVDCAGRSVFVDDALPFDTAGHLMCSFSRHHPNELWVSILEKAYVKVRGAAARTTVSRTHA